MPLIARTVVDLALDRHFDYLIPDELQPRVSPGCRVTVPFGRRKSQGYVIEIVDGLHAPHLKPITDVLGDKALISEDLIRLARWMGRYYCAPVENAIRTVVPAAVRGRKAGFKKRLFVAPAGTPSEEELEHLRKRAPKQAAALDVVTASGSIQLAELVKRSGATASVVKSLEKKGLVKVTSESCRRDPLAHRNIISTNPLKLMAEQAAALEEVGKSIETLSPPVVLLYGVTGSGKTEVYLQAISRVLEGGGGAIVLVPEISLTPQTVERFVGRFGDRVAVLHSHLSDGERHDEWHRIKDGKADIVVGARSAVFAPVNNLGLIVVDEEHEHSYKQEDAPRYNARDVAVMRGHMCGCSVLLGSATPSLESWSNATKGKYSMARLPHRADHRKMPAMRIIDMRMVAEATGQVGVFSPDLLEAIRKRLDRGEQTILFLNRRGYSTSLVCPHCGYVAGCDQCSVAYTYHRRDEVLRCHICGSSRKVPQRCPSCQDPAFKYTGVGTQRVENIVQKCFPHAKVERMDADATTRKDSYERLLGDFRSGKTDILIGTQMIAKGLHFPNVTLVGVVYADLSLHMPDFRAGERTFQLLAQVAGRAGRGDVSGEVIVQTFTPFHPAVQAARRLDFEGFSDQELEFRRELNYPPYAHLACITLKGASEEKVSYCSSVLRRRLVKAFPESVTVSEASPAPLARAKGLFRYQIMLRSSSTKAMTDPLKKLLADFTPPKGVTHSIDIDALSLL